MAEYCGTETDRAAILALYDLDAEGFGALDDITGFAAALCETPIALVTIVEEERQRFLAHTGIDWTETPRETSFCAHAMLGDRLFVIPDAASDPRFADNPLVTGPPGVRFYAGAPLVSAEGVPLGALSIVDTKARNGLTPLQEQGLTILARQVKTHFEARRRDRAQAASHALALFDSEHRFRTLADAMPQMVWSALPDGHHDYYNARWYAFTGLAEGSTDGWKWADVFHPEDLDDVQASWRRSLETGAPYEAEYRLRHHDGRYRWALGRALPMRDATGRITRWMGTCTDIHEWKLAMEEREMVARELSHRIKNIFSVISGLIGLSARERPELADAATDLRDRVIALGRAHDYIRPRTAIAASEPGHNGLAGVLRELFAPYGEADRCPILIQGEDPVVDDRSATPLALLFHELATNSAKYGALSVPEGRVALTMEAREDDCIFHWREEGGPPVAAPATDGFGTRLMALSVERQLGGRIERDWRPDGLQVSLYIPKQAMSRDATGRV